RGTNPDGTRRLAPAFSPWLPTWLGGLLNFGTRVNLYTEQDQFDADERFARNVLQTRNANGEQTFPNSQFANGPQEVSFLFNLVKEVNTLTYAWAQTQDDGEEWLNGMDQYIGMVGLFTRKVMKWKRVDPFGAPD